MKESIFIGESSMLVIYHIFHAKQSAGCDVTHPAPGVTTRPSVASVVASMDEGATRYRVYLDAQQPRQELITNIAKMIDVSGLLSRLRRSQRVYVGRAPELFQASQEAPAQHSHLP